MQYSILKYLFKMTMRNPSLLIQNFLMKNAMIFKKREKDSIILHFYRSPDRLFLKKAAGFSCYSI